VNFPDSLQMRVCDTLFVLNHVYLGNLDELTCVGITSLVHNNVLVRQGLKGFEVYLTWIMPTRLCELVI